MSAFAAWDGEQYVQIASGGYSYDPERVSSVAFFPRYPSLAGGIVYWTGIPPTTRVILTLRPLTQYHPYENEFQKHPFGLVPSSKDVALVASRTTVRPACQQGSREQRRRCRSPFGR